MIWRIAEAKQHFSELLRRATDEPQEISNRDRVVAVVMGVDDARDFRAWQRERAAGSLAEALEEAQRICAADQYALPDVARADRPNPILMVNDVGRHKRHK